jgi:hypothetical protein
MYGAGSCDKAAGDADDVIMPVRTVVVQYFITIDVRVEDCIRAGCGYGPSVFLSRCKIEDRVGDIEMRSDLQ